jgi:WD40 repeat protein
MPQTMENSFPFVHGISSDRIIPMTTSINHFSIGGFKFFKDPNSTIVKRSSCLNVRNLTSAQIAYSPDGKMIYTGGHWDNSVRGYSMHERKTVFHRLWHSDTVTCLSIDKFGSKLISGSSDHSCCIWLIETNGQIVKNPVQTLFGHSKPIVGVAISTELDMAVSASGDGVCNVYSVRKGVFIRTLSATNQSISTISTITLSPEGYIVFPAISHNQSVSYLHLFSPNGKTLAVDCVDAYIKCVAIEGNRIATADNYGNVEVRRLFSLEVLYSLNIGEKIVCLHLTKNGSQILVGLESGQLKIFGPATGATNI